MAQLVSILEQFDKLLLGQLDIWAALTSLILSCVLLIEALLHILFTLHDPDRLSVLVNSVHLVTILLHLLLHLLLVDQELLLLFRC